MTAASARRRSLVLGGVGTEVAFQAGVLQVWLDEAGLEFDHADGTGTGVFNTAMYAQDMPGARIADNWRAFQPGSGLRANWPELPKLIYARSLFTLDRYRREVFGSWGLDFEDIRATTKEITFNAYNFSKHQVETLMADRLTEDFMVAAASLPTWFPPVVIDGQRYIDATHVAAVNVEEAIDRGADELWLVWTVSERGVWRDGLVTGYFQILEAAANGHLRDALRRIERNNAAVGAGGSSEYGRAIDVKLLRAEVPLHYLFTFSRDRLTEAVNHGVRAARRWCDQQEIPMRAAAPASAPPLTRLEFTEEMKGQVAFGEEDYEAASRDWRTAADLMFHLTIDIRGVNRFIWDPDHEAQARGYVESAAFGGRLPVERGTFNLFVDDTIPSRKLMRYRLHLRDGVGHPITLSGFKAIRDDPGFDAWRDTTTLYTRILRGHVEAGDEKGAEVVASGIIRIHTVDFLKQLTTFRTQAPTTADRLNAMRRFGQLFLGKLWDVYGTEVLSSSPI